MSEHEQKQEGVTEHNHKILVVGDVATGKTSIIRRLAHNVFNNRYKATIGVDYAVRSIRCDPDNVVRLHLWDIAGQERYGNMTRVYYREATGAVVVFDASRAGTFDGVQKWKDDIDSKVFLPDGSPIPVVLMANKCDLIKEGIVENPSKMDAYCQEKGFLGWFETSAKDNLNIDRSIHFLVNSILENGSRLAPVPDPNVIHLTSATNSTSTTNPSENGKRRCC